MKSLSSAFKIEATDIETELRRAKEKLNDAVWEENEELQKALKRQIIRLEVLKEIGERVDVNY